VNGIPIDSRVISEINRMFQKCITDNASLGSKLTINWIRETPASMPYWGLTWLTTAWYGPSEWDVSLQSGLVGAFGSAGWNGASLNISDIAKKARELGVDPSDALATVIGHEIGWHTIAGGYWHVTGQGFIDSGRTLTDDEFAAKVGGNFSPHASRAIVLGLNQFPKSWFSTF
jgi:hypothetical protein